MTVTAAPVPDSTAPIVAVQSNGGTRPVPDPTLLTDKAIDRAISAMRDWAEGQFAIRDERLRGIDDATTIRLGVIDHMPDEINQRVARLADLTEERFTAAAKLSERESALNKDALVAAFNASKEAVAAALTTQKESAAVAERTNQAAIDKSERATAETILTNSELSRTRLDALTKNLDDVKERVGRIESQKVGATENRTGIYATVGIVITLGLFGMALIGFFATRSGA